MSDTHLAVGGAQPHTAATYFAEQLAKLIEDNRRVRMLNTGRTARPDRSRSTS